MMVKASNQENNSSSQKTEPETTELESTAFQKRKEHKNVRPRTENVQKWRKSVENGQTRSKANNIWTKSANQMFENRRKKKKHRFKKNRGRFP